MKQLITLNVARGTDFSTVPLLIEGEKVFTDDEIKSSLTALNEVIAESGEGVTFETLVELIQLGFKDCGYSCEMIDVSTNVTISNCNLQ